MTAKHWPETAADSNEQRERWSSMSGGLKLDNIIFTGRTCNEYMRMFNLTAEDVAHETCPGGASSFPAVAKRRSCSRGGHRVWREPRGP